MGCGRIAFKELNIPIGKYYASEVDKFAKSQVSLSFPNVIHLGDVRSVDVSKLDKIDFLIGGSPCKDLSFAGKRSGLICNDLDSYLELRSEWLRTKNERLYYHNDKFQESILFWEYVRILKEVKEKNPDAIFFLENVRMKKVQQAIINDALGLRAFQLNSQLFSAQKRDRYYWTNIRTKKVGFFSEVFTDFPAPIDKGLVIADILQEESEIPASFYLSDKAIETGILHKARSKQNGSGFGPKFHTKGEKMGALTVGGKGTSDLVFIGSGINARGAIKMQRTELGKSIRKESRKKGIDFNPYREKELKGIDINKFPTLMTGPVEDNLIGIIKDSKFKVRRITALEATRLQTVPSWYKWDVSDTQIHKMCGNGWTIDAIKYMFSFIKD